MGVRRNFSRGGTAGILLILFSLLAMQRKWTYPEKCPMLRQQLQRFPCEKMFVLVGMDILRLS